MAFYLYPARASRWCNIQPCICNIWCQSGGQYLDQVCSCLCKWHYCNIESCLRIFVFIQDYWYAKRHSYPTERFTSWVSTWQLRQSITKYDQICEKRSSTHWQFYKHGRFINKRHTTLRGYSHQVMKLLPAIKSCWCFLLSNFKVWSRVYNVLGYKLLVWCTKSHL